MTNRHSFFRTWLICAFLTVQTACIGLRDSGRHPEDITYQESLNEAERAELLGQNSKTEENSRFSVNPEDLDARLAESWFSHRTRRGETLAQIARKYGTSIAAIRKANRIRGNSIYAGQSLIIPTVSQRMGRHDYPDLSELWDRDLAEQLARESFYYAFSKKARGKCLRGVRIALTRSLQKTGVVPFNQRLFLGQSAHQFKTWAINNPAELCRKYKLVPIIGNEEQPMYPGLIYVYGRGRCGFSKRYGHVETVVSTEPGMVCSDGCRNISTNACRPDLILAPSRICPDQQPRFVSTQSSHRFLSASSG